MKLNSRVVCLALVVVAGFAASCSGSDFTVSSNAAGGGGSLGLGGAAGTLSASSGAGGHVSGAAGKSSANGGSAGRGTAGTHAGGAAHGGEAGEIESAGAAGEPVTAAGAGGEAGMSSAGAAGTGGCAVVSWFPDGDKDGYGRSSGEVKACEPPSGGVWVKRGGDCNDDSDQVFPNNPAFYREGYTTSGNTLSFDYDCSNKEEIDPGALGAAPQCGVLSCSGSGFQDTGRTGSGVNGLCGSKKLVTCTPPALTCSGVVTDVDGAPCH